MNGKQATEALEWTRPLRYRRGAYDRLGGLDIYFDFDWRAVFSHNRSIFPRGQSLSQLVQRECPETKTPRLLLTERDDVNEGFHELDADYFVIVKVHDYLKNAGADAASSYYARLLDAPLIQHATLADVTFSAGELGSFLDEQLTPASLTAWLERNPERRAIIQSLIQEEVTPFPGAVTQALRGLEGENPEVLEEFAKYLERVGGIAPFAELLKRVTTSELGRTAATLAMADRLDERISDVRTHLQQYEELIINPTSTETEVQRFLETHPWIVGLAYVNARPRVEIPRGELDFVLDRYDGFFDILEFKGPNEQIVIERQETGAERPSSASKYSLSRPLSAALAQAHHYRAILEQGGGLRAQYGLQDTRQPRIMIVIGKTSTLTESGEEILRQLNLSLHRVEVIPFDLLGARTSGLLDNVEALLKN